MIVEYDDIILARNDLHTQGYSVIEIDSIQDDSIIGNNEDFFYFDIQFQNATRSGKIQAKDILTAYKRLVEEMGYTVISIYASKNATLEEKIYTTNAVKSSYEVFLHSKKTEEKVIQERKNTSEIHQNDVLSREITRYQALIDRTIQKIQKIFITYNSILTEDKKLKLQEIATVLTRIKQITNVEKLKQI
jgi:hypothetical protein